MESSRSIVPFFPPSHCVYASARLHDLPPPLTRSLAPPRAAAAAAASHPSILVICSPDIRIIRSVAAGRPALPTNFSRELGITLAALR